jgi:hypothetical protein
MHSTIPVSGEGRRKNNDFGFAAGGPVWIPEIYIPIIREIP